MIIAVPISHFALGDGEGLFAGSACLTSICYIRADDALIVAGLTFTHITFVFKHSCPAAQSRCS